MASITITSPANGAVVKGNITVKVEYRGPGFIRTDLYRDNTLIGTSTMSTASFAVNTTALADGGHTFKAVSSFKQHGGETVQAQVTVTVSNVAPPPPPPPPPTPLYPTSYYSGPLSSNNILPATYGGSLVIMWCDTSGDTGIAASNRALVQQRMTDCSRTFDGIGLHYGASDAVGSGGSLGSGGEAWVDGLGSVPIVSWSPNVNSTTNATIGQIKAGSADTHITASANYFKTLPFRVMIRMMWEHNGNWLTWCINPGPANGNVQYTAADFITAWQRVVSRFQAAGASNVGFFYCPQEAYNITGTTAYPGDGFVDWVGSDVYNFDNDGWATPLHGGWAEFDEIFNYGTVGASTSMYNTFSGRKPFVVGETSSKFDTAGIPAGHVADANRKANWFKNIALVAKPKMPLLCGIQVVDQWLLGEGHDWRVDSKQPSGTASKGATDATTYTGFKAFAADPAFNVGVAA